MVFEDRKNITNCRFVGFFFFLPFQKELKLFGKYGFVEQNWLELDTTCSDTQPALAAEDFPSCSVSFSIAAKQTKNSWRGVILFQQYVLRGCESGLGLNKQTPQESSVTLKKTHTHCKKIQTRSGVRQWGREGEWKRQREMCIWSPGSWLPIIITLVILHTSFPFIFDTLHLLLITWNPNINTVPGPCSAPGTVPLRHSAGHGKITAQMEWNRKNQSDCRRCGRGSFDSGVCWPHIHVEKKWVTHKHHR